MRPVLGLPQLLLLVAISGLGPLTLNGVLPATAAVIDELDTRYALAQLVLSVYLLATLVSQICLGPLADRVGRRPVMIGSLALFAFGSLGCAFAPTIGWLLAMRFVQGLGGAVCVFLPRAIVRDVHPPDRAASVIGYMTTAMMVAPLFGPALGGWITERASWRLMYLGLAALGVAFAFASLGALRETLARTEASPGRAPARGALATLLGERAFVAWALLMSGTVGVYYGFLAGAPYVAMQSRGLDAATFGAWFAMVPIGYLSGNFVAGRFSERVGISRMVLAGLIPFALGVALFWLLSGWRHPLALFAPMMLVALCNGMSLPNMVSGAMSVRPALAASASGLSGGLQTAFGVALTLALGVVLPAGERWLFVFATLSAALAAAGLWVGRDAVGSPGAYLAGRPWLNAARR